MHPRARPVDTGSGRLLPLPRLRDAPTLADPAAAAAAAAGCWLRLPPLLRTHGCRLTWTGSFDDKPPPSQPPGALLHTAVMSTPSTATATLPPPHHNKFYHQYPQPISNPPLGAGSARAGTQGNQLYNNYINGSSNNLDIRRAPATQPKPEPQEPHLPPPAISDPLQPSMASQSRQGGRRRNPPDWNAFYANGIPKEVIVIEDDDDPPVPHPPQHQQRYPNGNNGSDPGRHADKKRKTAASTAYDPVYAQNTSYSTTQTPYYESQNHSLSTDRNNSGLTAPSSLGSQPSVGQQIAPLDASAAGQKRKRTRAAVQDEAKRRELDNPDLHPFGLYHPPPNPPIKAKDVHVEVIPDVSRTSPSQSLPAINVFQKNPNPRQKCDDDDGHYIIQPEADLTERCTAPPSLPLNGEI